MKRTLFQILAVAAVGAMCSCSDFLDPYPSAIRSEEYILTNPTTMQGLIGKCYDYMAQNYNDNEGAYLDCATDNAVRTSTTDVLRRFAVGVTSPTNDPFETYWDRDYKGIYNVNMFLKDDRGLNMRYMLDEHLDELLRNRLWGEAYALRAWFQWDLLQKFGGRGTDGRLLGYPILLEPVRVWEMSPEEMRGLRFERNTYDECVAQILRDCDSAYKYLPIAHRDFLVPNADDRRVLGAQKLGSSRRHQRRGHQGAGLPHVGQPAVQSRRRRGALAQGRRMRQGGDGFQDDGGQRLRRLFRRTAGRLVRPQQPRNRLRLALQILERRHGTRLLSGRLPGQRHDGRHAGAGRCFRHGRRLSDRRVARVRLRPRESLPQPGPALLQRDLLQRPFGGYGADEQDLHFREAGPTAARMRPGPVRRTR